MLLWELGRAGWVVILLCGSFSNTSLPLLTLDVERQKEKVGMVAEVEAGYGRHEDTHQDKQLLSRNEKNGF